MKIFTHVFLHWLPIGSAIILIGGFSYAAIHQTNRNSLNDPQIGMVNNAIQMLLTDKKPAEVVSFGELSDIGNDLEPFVAIYDEKGNPIESSGYLDNLPPKPPFGVFEYAKIYGENRVTWQPNPTTRVALVIKPVNINTGWFVAAGRNTQEVESRQNRLSNMALGAIALSLIVSFVLYFIADTWRRKNAHHLT